ncbi:unnamed protein product [Mytilus coruscus]|uniref:Uncharacterized protein n=1 Tax=Mytilus coruscus TaxID=42192 RepID=A0A6J8A802_MYTCO|nr:unnamed protein product [Mytilus coruscus]
MLQSGKARGTPRLIGFLIPTSNGRTRLRLMPGRGRVDSAGMPLNIRTIVAAARRANLLPTNATRTNAQTRGIRSSTRTNQQQNRIIPQRRRQNEIRRPQTSGRSQTSGRPQTSVDEVVEVTINHTGPNTAGAVPSSVQTQNVPTTQLDQNSQQQSRNRFLDTMRSMRRTQTSNRLPGMRRLNVLDRSTGLLTTKTMERSNIDTSSQNRRVNTLADRNRMPESNRNRIQDTNNNRLLDTPTEPVDLFNSPRSVNLIGDTGSSNGQSGDQTRKVFISINTNQGGSNNNNDRKNVRSDNNLSQGAVSMFDNTKLQNNNRFQNFGTRDQLSAQNRNVFDRQSGNNFDGQSQDPHNFLTPVNPEPFNQNGVDHNSNHFNDPGLKDHHPDVHNNHQNTPTFLASSSQNINQAHSSNNNEQTSGLSSQQNTQTDKFAPNSNFVGHQTSAQSNSHTQMNNPDLLNDQNIAKLHNNQLSGLTIHDIFPGMQMGKKQQILRPLSNPVNEFPSQHTHNDNFNQPNRNSFQSNSNFQNINQQSIQTASPKIENIQSTQTGNPKNENLQSLLQQVITKLLAANNNIGAAPVITQPVTHHDMPPSSNNNNDLSSLGNSLSSNLNTMNTLQQTPSTSTGMDNSHINQIGGIQPQNQPNTLQQSPSTSTGMDNSHINPIGGKQPQNQANTLQSLLKNLLQKTTGSGGLAVNQKLIHTTQNMIGNKQQAPGSGTANQNQLNSIQNMIGPMQQTPGSGGQANQLHSIQNMLGNKQQEPGSSGQVENQNQLTPIQNMLGTMQLTPGSGGQASNQNQRLSIQNMLGTMQQTPGLSGQASNQNQLNSLQNMLETMQQTPTLGGQTSNQNQVHSIQNMLGNIQQAPGSGRQTANQNQLNSIQNMMRNKQQAPGSSGQATNQNQLNSIQNMLGTMQQTPVLSGQASNQNQFHSIQNMLGGIQQAPGLGGQADNQNQLLSIQNMLGTMQLTKSTLCKHASGSGKTKQNQLNSIQNMMRNNARFKTPKPTSGPKHARTDRWKSNQNQLLSIQNMLGNKQNNVPSMSTTNFATKQQQFTGQPATISNSKSNPQDNLSVLLQTLLKQNNLGTNTNQDLQNSNQLFGLNGLLSNANTVPHTNINQQNNPNTLNTPTDTNLATAQRIVNIQMQNALQPHDFGLSGGHDISHINTFGHSTNNLAAQMNPNMLNIHNLLQGNPLLQSIASTQNQGRNMLIGHNLPQNNMLNNMMTIPITNNLQNSLNNNQGLRQLLQRNIQQILMKQNNQIVGAQGFLGLNNASKSFPNNQLAPSDVVIDNTTRNSTGTTFTPTSIKVGAIQTLNLTVNPTKPSLFSTFETFFPTKQVLVDTHGSLPKETLNTLPTKHVLDTHGSMPIETLNTLPTKHVLDTHGSMPIETLNTLPTKHVLDTHGSMSIETLNTLPTKHVLDTHGSMPMDTLNTLPTKHVLDTHGSMPMETLNTLPTKHVLVETHGSIPIDILNNSVAIIYHPNATTVNLGNNFGTLMDNITSTNNTGSEIYNLTRDLNITANNNVTSMSNTSFIGIATYTNLTANVNDVITYTNMTEFLSNATITSNATNATITLNATNDIVNSTILYSTNVSSVNISDVLPTAPVVPVSSTNAKPHIIDISVSTTMKPSALDILGPNGRLTSTLKKSLGIKNVDKATLKGLISNVLRDLFKQNFIDPVKGTLKASLNYTTMLNSVKKVLMKSKNKLLKLRQQVAISPAKMQSILNSRGLGGGSKHLQHVSSMSPSPLPVTKFVTTQPSIIKQPTLEAPTPAQLIIDSVGNHGVITNQHFGPTPGGGVAVWYSKPSKASSLVGSGTLSQSHQTYHLSNPVIQSSGDFSINGMAAPSDISAIPVTSPGHAVSLFATSNPIGFNDILNPVTHIPNILTTVSSMQPQNHISDPTLQLMAMSTPTSQISNLGKLISHFVDVAFDSISNYVSVNAKPVNGSIITEHNSNNTNYSVKTNSTTYNLTDSTFPSDRPHNMSVQINSTLDTRNTGLNISQSNSFFEPVSVSVNTSDILNQNMTVVDNSSIIVNTTTQSLVTQTSTVTTTMISTSTTEATTTTEPGESIRLPDGTIINASMLENIDPEQAEILSELSERGA